MLVSGLGFILYLGFAIPLMQGLGFWGIALANSISYSIQGIILLILINRQIPERFSLKGVIIRASLSAMVAGLSAWLVFSVLPIPISSLFLAVLAGGVGVIFGIFPILREIRQLSHL
jgi:peptidoglycan biosynthesis protein MviN/MurJ (putative lipid II flippase)